MNPLFEALIRIGLKFLGKFLDKFFRSKRGKKIKSLLPSAGTIVAVIAAHTDTKVDDHIAAVINDLALSGTPSELFDGKWGDIILREVAKRMLKEENSEASDSEAGLAIELVINELKAENEEGLKDE